MPGCCQLIALTQREWDHGTVTGLAQALPGPTRQRVQVHCSPQATPSIWRTRAKLPSQPATLATLSCLISTHFHLRASASASPGSRAKCHRAKPACVTGLHLQHNNKEEGSYCSQRHGLWSGSVPHRSLEHHSLLLWPVCWVWLHPGGQILVVLVVRGIPQPGRRCQDLRSGYL